MLEQDREEKQALFEQYQKLQTVFKGNAFVEYIAEEQLMSVSRDASERLGILTRQRYAIEVDSQGGFIMRDDANGGVKRPVSTLSGGNIFNFPRSGPFIICTNTAKRRISTAVFLFR